VIPRSLRYVLVVLVLAAAYSFLAALVFERMPYVFVPSWWWSLWPNRWSGLIAWFIVLNAVGSLIAALPVALLIAWGVGRNRLATSYFTAGACAVLVIAQSLAPNGQDLPHAAGQWLNKISLFVALLVAVPLLVRLLDLLPSNYRLDRTRGAGCFD
jgi:hypothetical protein